MSAESNAAAGPEPTSAQAASTPQIIIQQQVTLLGRFGKLLLIALVLAVITIVSLMSRYQQYFSPANGPQERYHSLNREAKKKIAIITVAGTIISPEGFVKQQIDRARKDDDVVAIVLRINSPGGTVTASDYLYHHLNELVREKREEGDFPLVVSMGSLCASGGYYIAMAVGDQPDSIFAEPTTWTGSIGVVIPHYDLSGLLTELEIKDDSIASHRMKLMGSPTRQLSDEERQEERAVLQALVDESFQDFKDIVRRGRPKLGADAVALDSVATGQIFTAKQARAAGLVDRIGFIESAIERAAELAGYSTDDVRCVKYRRPPSALDVLFGSQASSLDRGERSLASLLDLTTPRAYYLFTLLPSLLSNSQP